VLGLVLSTFSHAGNGAPFVVTLLHAMARGMWSFAAFCFGLALLLPSRGIFASFVLAVLLSLCVQAATRSRQRRTAGSG
jgi:hypothetical protein